MPPGLIIKSRFIRPAAKAAGGEPMSYQDFLNYMAREKAKQRPEKENEEELLLLLGEASYPHYLEYMDNREKTENLFTADRDELSPADKAELRRLFSLAQDNRAIMWQNVISFDNDWLRETGVIDRNGVLDRAMLMDAARASMSKLLKAEGMTASAIWTASIHYNTDNYHIHFAITEPYPCREHMVYQGNDEIRGYFRKSSLAKAKSAVVSTIMGRQEENERINELIRNRLVGGLKDPSLPEDPKIAYLYDALMKRLPTDTRLWKYNMNAIADERPLIDAITERYMELFHPDDYASLLRLLDLQQEKYNRAYGNSGRSYRNGKLEELYTRMGNAILRELRAERSRERVIRKAQLEARYYSPGPCPYSERYGISAADRLGRDVSGLLRALNRAYDKDRARYEYDLMIEEILAEQVKPVGI